MGHIKLTIITPTTQYHAEDGDLVTVTSKSGSEGFMAGHVPTVVAIVPGPLRYRLISENETNKEPEWRNFFASVGYAEVSPTEVMVVVTAADWLNTLMWAGSGALNRQKSESIILPRQSGI